jgi:hypothetical protein
MQTPVATIETRGGSLHGCRGYYSNRNGSSAISALVPVGWIKVVIWNKEPLIRFQMYLRGQGNIYK